MIADLSKVAKAALLLAAALSAPRAIERGRAQGDASNEWLPNFVLIFTDDQGYQDVGCFGAPKIRTPHLDRMAEEGMQLRDFYAAAPTCTQSRAALLTGCYPKRIGMTSVLFPKTSVGLHPDETTIAEILKSKGYATACIGKWHVGDQTKFLPTRQGFDSYFGVPYSNDMRTKRNGVTGISLMRDEKIIEHPVELATLTKRYTEEAIRFVEAHRDGPFFLYLPHTMPHVPLAASPEFRGKSKGGLYGDVIEEIDWSVGRILAKLVELGIDERTLVVFTSDNGPALGKNEKGGAALPLRGGKLTTNEGGMRVPCIVRWPGRVPAGSVCREPAMTIDLLPTLASLAHATLPDDRTIDGRDIWPLLAGEKDARSPHDALYYYRGAKLEAVRSGRWKLHFPRKIVRGKDGPKAKGAYKLYNLDRDVSESKNVARVNPDIVERLSELAIAFDEELKRNARPIGKL